MIFVTRVENLSSRKSEHQGRKSEQAKIWESKKWDDAVMVSIEGVQNMATYNPRVWEYDDKRFVLLRNRRII